MPSPCCVPTRCAKHAAEHRERCHQQYLRNRFQRIAKAQAARGVADGFEARHVFAIACGRRWFRWLFELAPEDAAQACAIAALLHRAKDAALSRRVQRDLRELAKDLGYLKNNGKVVRYEVAAK